MQILLVGGVEHYTSYSHLETQDIGGFTIINTCLLRSFCIDIQLAEREGASTKTVPTSKLTLLKASYNFCSYPIGRN